MHPIKMFGDHFRSRPDMKIHQLSATEAIVSLKSAANGLTLPEVERRLVEFGPNAVKPAKRKAPWLRLTQEVTSFFSLILWIAAGLAFFAEWNDPGQGMARIGYALITVILVSGFFSFWQEHRVEKTLEALRNLLPQRCLVWRDGTVARELAERLVPGDIVQLEPGDKIPADCRVIDGYGVRVNNAAVTGESAPQARDAAAAQSIDLLDSPNVLLAGTLMAAGRAKAVVFATGARTEFGKIANLTQTAGDEPSPLRLELMHLSRLTALIAIVIGVLFFSLGWFIGIPFWKAFIFAIGIIVAMVPEGLLPTLTLSLVLATQRMAKRHVLIRYLPAVETLGSTTVICTDKTGTLTQNRMVAKRIFLGGMTYSPSQITPSVAEAYRPFFQVARACHDLSENRTQARPSFDGDATEIALVEMALSHVGGMPIAPRFDEIPFDTARMRLSTLHGAKEGGVLYCKGAPEAVLPLCTHVLVNGSVTPLTPDALLAIKSAHADMAQQGLRVLALAYKERINVDDRSMLEHDLVFGGLAALEDPPRPEVIQALKTCHDAGIQVIMVTGDHPQTALAVAWQIGLVKSAHPTVITGDQLRTMSDIGLQLALDDQEILFARVIADQKMRIVEALKQKKHIVAVTGDGINDAPALKTAHIGIAMGITGSDVAKEAADMVLLDDNFASIVDAIEEGRAVFENIRKFLTYVLVHNVAELIPYLGFLLFKIPLALTPIQALSIDMGSDTIAALGLGVERPSAQLMRRPPRPQGQRLMNWQLATRAYLFLGLIEAAAAMTVFFSVLYSAGWVYGQLLDVGDPLYQQATTACLSTIIVMQMVNVFLCRSATQSVFSVGLFSNRLIILGVVSEAAILLLTNYTPWGRALLGTAPLGQAVWLLMIPYMVGMCVLEELRKWWARRSERAHQVPAFGDT